ncbi:MAG: hypothetical protein ACLS3C_16285 [Oscillospiraceae bacterium]
MTGEKNDGFVFIDRFICLEELCKLCHISKRKAKWLLDNEIIPTVSAAETRERHRYKICKLSDATTFQKDQESDRVHFHVSEGTILVKAPGEEIQLRCSLYQTDGFSHKNRKGTGCIAKLLPERVCRSA